jgi:pimeloyl-ACP methyl ester carboxylesterase
MGGWLMLLVARALGPRVAGLVGIAAAPDFTEWGYDADQQARLERGETVLEDNPYGPEPTPTHPGFWTDGQARRLLGGVIALDCPVRLLHGQADADVPPEIALRLARALRSQDVQVTLVKHGDHRLSREGDIALLLRTVATIA